MVQPDNGRSLVHKNCGDRHFTEKGYDKFDLGVGKSHSTPRHVSACMYFAYVHAESIFMPPLIGDE